LIDVVVVFREVFILISAYV